VCCGFADGDRCNDELLLSYGFSVEGNPDDTYVMSSPAIQRLLAQGDRLQLLQRLGLERHVNQVRGHTGARIG
jgi:hypothetical protein